MSPELQITLAIIAIYILLIFIGPWLTPNKNKAEEEQMKKVKVWECKILVPEECELPPGFDAPPRQAAIAAVESAGIQVFGCASGWGGRLTKTEQEVFEATHCESYQDIYFSGAMDAPEDKSN